jgi:hypothetical protein
MPAGDIPAGEHAGGAGAATRIGCDAAVGREVEVAGNEPRRRNGADRDQDVIARNRGAVLQRERGHTAAAVSPGGRNPHAGADCHSGISPALGQKRAHLAAERAHERRRSGLDESRRDTEGSYRGCDLRADQACAHDRKTRPADQPAAHPRGIVERAQMVHAGQP